MAEKEKKAKAPAKPRATTTRTRKTSTKEATPVVEAVTPTHVETVTPTHEEIARLAQQFWAERGHTDGHAEQDWLRAEQELMLMAS